MLWAERFPDADLEFGSDEPEYSSICAEEGSCCGYGAGFSTLTGEDGEWRRLAPPSWTVGRGTGFLCTFPTPLGGIFSFEFSYSYAEGVLSNRGDENDEYTLGGTGGDCMLNKAATAGDLTSTWS